MDNRVDSIRVLKCDARIDVRDVLELQLTHSGELAESNLLESLSRKAARSDFAASFVHIDAPDFVWNGEGSGMFWHVFTEHIAPRIKGTVETFVMWNGGDFFTGLRIRDGVVTEPEIVMSLADEPEAK